MTEKITARYETKAKTDWGSRILGISGSFLAAAGVYKTSIDGNIFFDNLKTYVMGTQRADEPFYNTPVSNSDAVDMGLSIAGALAAAFVFNRVAANLMGNTVTYKYENVSDKEKPSHPPKHQTPKQ